MYPTAGFAAAPMAFAFPGQQGQASLYQSQFAGVAGFTPQMTPTFQQGPPSSRGQSLPASARQYATPPAGPYAWPRRQPHEQYPPPAPSQNYEYQSRHGSKGKKHHKRRSVSPGGAGEPGLYSDKERRDVSGGQHERSRSPSPAAATRVKQEGVAENIQQISNGTHSHQADGAQGAGAEGVARSEEEQAVGEHEKHKSSSKKKKHSRRESHENYNTIHSQGVPYDVNPYQQAYAPQQYIQQAPAYGDYQHELPAQLKVHRQPLYSGYNQAYEESIRRGDVYRKQAKRSTRLPPEVKQQLLPHEDDRKSQVTPQLAYPYGTVSGVPQQLPTAPQPIQPYPNIRPPFNGYQPYGNQQGYYAPAPYSAVQPWANVAAAGNPADQEIQRLRSHIHTLEGELNKLQRKLTKTGLSGNNQEQDESKRSRRRSKRDDAASPRQTPVIVELNNAAGESKKHRHRTASNTSAQQGSSNAAQQDHSSAQRSGNVAADHGSGQQVPPVQPPLDTRDNSRGTANLAHETGDQQGRSGAPKNPREETAAQLAHAAAAHVNSRQTVNIGPAQPPAPLPQPPVAGPPPPQVGRPPMPNQQQQQQQQLLQQQQQFRQQQQQQQFLYQQGAVRPQGPPLRGPAPRAPVAGNIRFPGDLYRPPLPPQQQQQPQFHPSQQQQQAPNPNYNQSNNNELFDGTSDDDDDTEEGREDEEQNRSAEKILDAFERYYLNRGAPSTAPLKVKYIPEGENSHLKTSKYSSQGNTNNNNRYRSTSRRSRSHSASSSESIYSNSAVSAHKNNHRETAAVTTGPFI